MTKTPLGFVLSPLNDPARQLILAVSIGILYFLCAAASRLLLVQPQDITPIWPPSGLLLAALLLSDRRAWPGMVLAGFAANLLANWLTGGALGPSLGFTLANCAESVLAAALLARLVGRPITLTRLRDVVGIVGAAVGVNGLTAMLGAAVARLTFGAPFWSTWLTWWIANGLAILLVGSTILAWAAPPIDRTRLALAQVLELVLLYAGAIVVAILTFGGPHTAFSYPYQVFPFLLWFALRFGPRQTTVISVVLAGLILFHTLQDRGPFGLADEAVAWRMLAAQVFLGVVMSSALVLAAAMAERQRALAGLQQAQVDQLQVQDELERRVAARTAELTKANQRLQQEIGERQRAEAFLNTVLQQMPSGVAITDAASGKLIMHNPAAEELLGSALFEHAIDVGLSRLDAMHPDGRLYAPHEYPLARALYTHKVVREEEVHLRRVDGSTAIVSIDSAPIRDASGQLIATVSTFHDLSKLKQMEMTLADSQARLSNIIASAMDAIITVDDEQRITIWNLAAERMFGCPAAEALGQSLDRFIPARYRSAHRQHIQAFGRTGITNRTMGELRSLAAIRADGTEFPIEASISQVSIGDRRLYTVILRDVTAREQAEIALRTSEERFSKAFQTSRVAMVISMLADGRILDVNDSFARLFGRDRETTLGQSSVLLDMWADPADRPRAIARLSREGTIRDLEVAIRAAGGEIRDVMLSADVLDLAGEPCIITTLYDISERKRAEAALRESRQQLQSILDNAPALISLKRSDGQYLLVNRRFEALCHRKPELIVGSTDSDLFPANLAMALQAHDRLALERGSPLEVEEIVAHDDGPHTYSSVKFPLTDVRGAPYALGSIAIDITERKQLEAQLFQAQKIESIGQLAGGIAHDFNNLLTGVIGYAELAISNLPPDSPARGDLQELRKAADRAASLTRQLLVFARRQPINPRVVSLNTLIAELDKLLRRLINEDIELVVRLADDLRHVKVDPGQIEQVVINLVVNARDAMPDGGQLTIETANVALDPRFAHGHLDIPAGRYVMLAVIDTGMGMPPEIQTHVFEPFFTTKEPGRGTGLGLSTCYGIVKQHGGTIWIYSEPGNGTAIKVYLPQVSADVEPADDREQNAPMPRGTETILVVEDEPSVRALVVRLLRSCGYTVIEAANGAGAVQLARTYQPATINLLLTDMVMPQMGGRAAAEHVRKLYPGIKVLFMSGYTEHATIQNSRIEPVSPFLQKPFTPAALAQAVRDVLDGEAT